MRCIGIDIVKMFFVSVNGEKERKNYCMNVSLLCNTSSEKKCSKDECLTGYITFFKQSGKEKRRGKKKKK